MMESFLQKVLLGLAFVVFIWRAVWDFETKRQKRWRRLVLSWLIFCAVIVLLQFL